MLPLLNQCCVVSCFHPCTGPRSLTKDRSNPGAVEISRFFSKVCVVHIYSNKTPESRRNSYFKMPLLSMLRPGGISPFGCLSRGTLRWPCKFFKWLGEFLVTACERRVTLTQEYSSWSFSANISALPGSDVSPQRQFRLRHCASILLNEQSTLWTILRRQVAVRILGNIFKDRVELKENYSI